VGERSSLNEKGEKKERGESGRWRGRVCSLKRVTKKESPGGDQRKGEKRARGKGPATICEKRTESPLIVIFIYAHVIGKTRFFSPDLFFKTKFSFVDVESC
jgi:hypothetical protein